MTLKITDIQYGRLF